MAISTNDNIFAHTKVVAVVTSKRRSDMAIGTHVNLNLLSFAMTTCIQNLFEKVVDGCARQNVGGICLAAVEDGLGLRAKMAFVH
jgi:hypothetical protein